MYNNYINEKGEELFQKHGCSDGIHPLIPIYSCSKAERIETVKWCPICGSYIIDIEYKNNIRINDIAKMRKPDISIRTKD